MNLDIYTLGGTMAVLVLNLGFVLWLGFTNFGMTVIHVDARDVDRRATERMLRRNLGLRD